MRRRQPSADATLSAAAPTEPPDGATPDPTAPGLAEPTRSADAAADASTGPTGAAPHSEQTDAPTATDTHEPATATTGNDRDEPEPVAKGVAGDEPSATVVSKGEAVTTPTGLLRRAERVLRRRPAAAPASGSAVPLHLGLAAVAYVPLLLTQPGWVSADTKTYLYLDPSRLLGRAWSMWDPTYAAGTVTHQSIGFLWPMGPFYWLAEALGLPDWAGQRLWWGSIIFVAGAGVTYLLRTLGWRVPSAGVTAAVFVYALTPYSLALVARLSGILLPFSGLPWLLAFTIQALRHRGWRYPALFALTVATFGSVNATALVLVGLAPLLWLPYAVWSTREVPLPRAGLTAVKLGLLTVPVSAWWIAGLSVQATNGIEIIRYTETAKVVASTSTAQEVLRGLGYWFFYGTDRLGPWIEPSVAYTQWLPVIVVSYLVPLVGLAGAGVARWRHRGYFVLLVVVGMALAVGGFPRDRNPPFGRLVQVFQTSDVGLALRSLPRAVPLLVLGLAVLLGAGVTALVRRWPRLDRPLRGGAVALAVLALPALWLGQFVPDNLRRPEEVPGYWQDAARHLEGRDAAGASEGTRVLVLPGSDFASYRWGNTVDPILPGLMDRPSLQREAAPYGSPASVNLVNAFDLTLQERTADPDAVAPIARLLRSGDVLLVSDWQYERYNTPRPRNLWDFVSHAPGLGDPTELGPGEPNETIADVQLDDELLLLTDPDLPHPPELAAFPVPDPVPIVTTHPVSHPLLVAGDGAGLVDAAGAGLIDGTELIRYSATLDEGEIGAALDDGAALLLTDSNRKQGQRWTSLRHNRGYTETADGGPVGTDLSDNRMQMFPSEADEGGERTDSMSVTERHAGGDAEVTVEAEATSYGNPISFAPEERASLAVDGDPETAWRTAGFADARGERLELTLSEPVTTDHIRLVQAFQPPTTRFVTRARLHFRTGDGSETSTEDVDLTMASRAEPGQVVRFPERRFSSLSIEILADSAGWVPRYAGQSSVGFAEVEIEGARPVDEAVRLPTDLLDAAGPASQDNPLAISLTRLRQDPSEPTRNDEEAALERLFELPSSRRFSLEGTARLSARADPHLVDELLGRPHDGSAPWVRADTDLAGSVATPAAAFDGDPSTAWTTERSRPRQWVEVVLPEPVTIDRLPLTVVADGLHSVPTEVELWVDGVPLPDPIDVPEIADGDRQNATREAELDIPEVTGSRFRVRITEVRRQLTNDWVTDRPVAQPAAIAEIGLPGPTVPALPETFDSGCRDDLLQADGEPIPIQVTGSTADAVAGRPLTITPCTPDGETDSPQPGAADPTSVTDTVDQRQAGPAATAGPTLDLDTGRHRLESRRGLDTGIDIDQLVLRSAAGGDPSSSGDPLVAETTSAATPMRGAQGGDGPRVEVSDEGPDRVRLRVSGATAGEPFWLVLGQSFNQGWQATVDGETVAAPELVDGFANGWLVDPRRGSFDVELRFTPQRRVDVALWLSAAAGLLCLLLALRRPRPHAGEAGGRSSGSVATVRPPVEPDAFTALATFRYLGARPGRRAAWLVGLGVGLLAWVLAGPLLGLVVGCLAGVAVRRERLRRLLLLGGPAAVAVVIAYVLYIQVRHAPQPSFDWPFELRRAHPLGWLAVLLLAADVVVDRTWRHTRRRTDRPGTPRGEALSRRPTGTRRR